MTSLILFILILILTIVIYIAVRKYAPVYFLREPTQEPPEVDEDEIGDFVCDQARIDLLHFQDTKAQYEQLRETIKIEIDAVKDYRYKKLTVLPSLVDDPIKYMELASWLTDNKRDFSEKREASLQRQLITTENHIYNCDKRIAKAKQTVASGN